MRQRTRQTALTVMTAMLAIVLLATSALAMMQPPAMPGRSASAPAATPDLGPEAFGVLPTIRPADGNGLDFDIPGGGPGNRNPVLDNISLADAPVTYRYDAMGDIPTAAPVVRLAVAPVTESAIRDLVARLDMAGSVQITRDGGQWDDSITATETSTGTRVILGSRGAFSYSAPDPGARCGEAVPTARIFPTPLIPPAIPATATPPPYGAGSDVCTSRGAAPDEAHAIAVAQDFLAKTGFTPDASTTLRALPPPPYAPSLRPVQWAAVAPNGGPLIGRDARMDTVVAVNPDNRVVNASGTTRTPDAASAYPLHSVAELNAALQAGDAYVTLTLPLDATGLPIIYQYNDPLAVQITATALGYALAYTFDARPYLLPVLRYTGTARNAASTAVGGEIGFTAYVDAVAHPAPTPASVTTTTPLPAAADPASLNSFTFTPVPFTRADFDALALALGYDNATTTVDTPVGSHALRAKYADGSTLGVNVETGEWDYDSGAHSAPFPIRSGTTNLAPAADVALAVVQQFVAAHHVNLDSLGPPVAVQPSPVSIEAYVCYPLLLNTMPVISPYGGTADCGITASVEAGTPHHLSLQASALLVAIQRGSSAGLRPTPASGNGAIPPQDVLDALALAPRPTPLAAAPSAPENPFGRLYVTDDPENAVHRRGNTTILSLTRGQAAPNLFTVTSIVLAYARTPLRTGTTQQMDQLQPVWRVTGQIDSGDRHRIAPFTYLSPAVR